MKNIKNIAAAIVMVAMLAVSTFGRPESWLQE